MCTSECPFSALAFASAPAGGVNPSGSKIRSSRKNRENVRISQTWICKVFRK